MDMLRPFLLTFIMCSASYCQNVCPSSNANNIHDVHQRGIVQRGVSYRQFCPELRAGEDVDGVMWYKGDTITNPPKQYLIGNFMGLITRKSERCAFSTNYSLVIKRIEEIDEGGYWCNVIPSSDTIDRWGKTHLIGARFTGVEIPASTDRESFERKGGRHTLQCQCTPRAPDAVISVVYWSTGEGVFKDTEIIGARFADGSVLQIQHGASYGIGSEFSLEINSLSDVPDEQRFWCHVIMSNGTLSSCYTDVTITDEHPPDSKLRATKSSFYLLSGKPAILPCTSWKPGGPACDVQWFKVDNSDRHLPTYNLSTGDLGVESGFDLAGSFSLLIRTVDESNAGRYRCDIDGGRIVWEAIDVLVIGNKFPLDGGNVTAGNEIRLNGSVTLECPVRLIDTTAEITIFWSFGAPDEQQSTTVIGNLVLPEGIRTMSDLGDNSCYGISYGGSLTLTKCSQDSDVRYWCHVFKEGDVLHRYYVDVTIDGPPVQVYARYVGLGVALAGIFLLIPPSIYKCRRHLQRTRRRDKYRGCDSVPTSYKSNDGGVVCQLGDLHVQHDSLHDRSRWSHLDTRERLGKKFPELGPPPYSDEPR